MRHRQAVEPVEKREHGVLVLVREPVLVDAFDEGDVVAAAETSVDRRDLPEGAPRAFDRHEILHRCRDDQRPRMNEQQQPGVVYAAGHAAERVLLGIAVRVVEDPVRHPHRQ